MLSMISKMKVSRDIFENIYGPSYGHLILGGNGTWFFPSVFATSGILGAVAIFDFVHT